MKVVTHLWLGMVLGENRKLVEERLCRTHMKHTRLRPGRLPLPHLEIKREGQKAYQEQSIARQQLLDQTSSKIVNQLNHGNEMLI